MFVCLFLFFPYSTGCNVLEQKGAVRSEIEQLHYEIQVFLEIQARDLCGCHLIIHKGTERAGRCSPMLGQFTVWPISLQQSIIPCQKAFSALLLPLREFLFGKSERNGSNLTIVRGKLGMSTEYAYRAAFWQKSLVSLLKCWEHLLSSHWEAWAPKVVGAFAMRAAKVLRRKYCWHFSLTGVSHRLALIPAQRKSPFWHSWIALWFLQTHRKVEDSASWLWSIG